MKYLVVVLAVALAAANAWAVVLHVAATPSDKPSDAVMGRWGTLTSCVAVGPQWVVMSSHQGGGVGTPVTLGGSAYVVSEIYDSGYDFRLARLTRPDGNAAALTDYVALSHDTVSPVGRMVVLGGYGWARGAELTDSQGVAYGYLWAASTGVLRWGTNTVDAQYGNFLSADFDAPLAKTAKVVRTTKEVKDATDCEAALACGDSGGGWFARHPVTQRWEMIGLSVSVSRDGASWFNPPDYIYAVRSSLCADWAEAIMAAAEPAPTLVVVAATDRDWVYENAPLSTEDGHAVVLNVSVTGDPVGNASYGVEVEQSGGSGLVVVEPTDDPLVWIVRGGPVDAAAAGDVILSVSVEGLDAGGEGQATCELTVRSLGDIDGNGGVEVTDLLALINCLNGSPPPQFDPRAFDLDANGAPEPTDVSLLINILNGLPVL
ncbi:MAG: hypothetical protein JXL80_02370 [Planctomycetes bacterium]|nr:hypothetical protein [Planctomycetota bacterium]